MLSLFEILRRAAADLLLPRVLSVMFLPMLAALILWGGLAWIFGATWLAALQGWLGGVPLPDWMGLSPSALGVASGFVLLLLLLPTIYLTALLITSLFLMPLLVGIVARRHYPNLEQFQGGSFSASLGNALPALVVYLPLTLLTLPFWILAPLGAAISLLLNAWLNKRLFIFDALAEHATAAELVQLRRAGGWPLFVLAIVLGLLHFLPLLNFFAPVYMGLAFTHYGLDRLAQMRKGLVT